MKQWSYNLPPVRTGPVAPASRLHGALLHSHLQAGRLRYKNHGFTVLEIVIASSIALIVFAIGYLAISTTTKTGDQVTKIIRDTENARLFFNMLERDLATALPGPGNIEKKRETQNQIDGYIHDPVNNPSPLVLTESVTGVAASSDILQFYCRTDNTSARDELTFVRYYVNRNVQYDQAHPTIKIVGTRLSRAALVYIPSEWPNGTAPDFSDNPLMQPPFEKCDPKGNLTSADDSTFAALAIG